MKTPRPYPVLNPQCLALVGQALVEAAPRSVITFYTTDWSDPAYGEFHVPQGLVDLLREGPPSRDPDFVPSLAACLQALTGLLIREAQVATLLALSADGDGLDLADELDLAIDVSPNGEAVTLCAGFTLEFAAGQWRIPGAPRIEAPTPSLRAALAAACRSRRTSLQPNPADQS